MSALPPLSNSSGSNSTIGIDNEDEWEVQEVVSKPIKTPAATTPAWVAKLARAHLQGLVTTVSDPLNLTEEEKGVLDHFSPLKKFIASVEFLLESISKVFPKCSQTKMALAVFRSYYKHDEKHQTELIRIWHQMMKPYYQDVLSNDPTRYAKVVHANIDLFQKLELPKKWNDKGFTTKSKENLVKQIRKLNKDAQTFCGFHTNFNAKVLGVASDVKAKIATGEINEANLSVEDLMKRGMEVAESMSEEDLMHVTENLPALMKQMGGSLGGGGVAGFDMSMMMKMMAGGKMK